MNKGLETISADKVDLEKVRWINHPNKVWERELILLTIHQKGTRTKNQLIRGGLSEYSLNKNLNYLTKLGKIQQDKLEYSRTSMKHRFHYEGTTGKLE